MVDKKKIPILIDTDLGDDVDDAAALIMVMGSPELELVGITTVYKDTVKRAQMVRELLKKKGFSYVPVYPGAERAMIETTEIEAPIQYEILENGMDNAGLVARADHAEAARYIVEQVKAHKELVIVALGMMTNLALAFLLDPDTMKKARIVGMGGEFRHSLPEWNIVCDPEAARIVMDQANNMTMFGLDITKYCGISDEDMDKLCTTEPMKYYMKGVKIFRDKTGYPIVLHDAVPIAWLICPEIAQLERCDYTVALEGRMTRGSIRAQTESYRLHSEYKKHFYYGKSLDFDKFFALVRERLF